MIYVNKSIPVPQSHVYVEKTKQLVRFVKAVPKLSQSLSGSGGGTVPFDAPFLDRLQLLPHLA